MKTRQWIGMFAAFVLAGTLTACDDNPDSRQASETTEQQKTAAGSSAPEEPGNTGNETMGGGQNNGAAEDEEQTMGMQGSKTPKQAVAVLQPTRDNEVQGTVRFTRQAEGVKVTARVTGLTPGKHGYHVHVNGDCSSPGAKSAGTHFNFVGSSENPPADIDRITGNLGNLEADDSGKANASSIVGKATLSGEKSIIGRSVIVHAKPNDPDQPPIGAAGARQACGVIKAVTGASDKQMP